MTKLKTHATRLRKSLNFDPGSKTREEVFAALASLGSRARAALRRRLKTTGFNPEMRTTYASGQMYDAFMWQIDARRGQDDRYKLSFRFGVSDDKLREGNRHAPSFYYDALDNAKDFDRPSPDRISQWLQDRGYEPQKASTIRKIIAGIARRQSAGFYKPLRLTATIDRSLSLKRINSFVQSVRKSITFS
jgi:hypothetical protein